MNTIQWKVGSKMTGSAERVYGELELIRSRDGEITPVAVVEKAEDEGSALHKYFEWDSDKAAERYRLEQARKVLRSIEIIHISAPSAPAKAYSIVTKPSKDPSKSATRKVYESTEEALKDPIMRDEVLGNAIREAVAFRRKYSALQELSQVFTAMDDFLVSFGT